MSITSAPRISTWPTTRAGSADFVACICSTVRNCTAIIPYREPGTARTRVATGNWYTCTATSRKPNASLDWPRRACLLMIFRIRVVSDLLEPCEAKVSSTVLRGGGGSNTLSLPGQRNARVCQQTGYPPTWHSWHCCTGTLRKQVRINDLWSGSTVPKPSAILALLPPWHCEVQ